MSKSENATRLLLLGNTARPGVQAILDDLSSFAPKSYDVVVRAISDETPLELVPRPHRIIVLGGDGTLIGVARSPGASQIPLIGVNIGKLGFLAEFSVEELKASFERCLHEPALVSRRLVLDVAIARNGSSTFRATAINDCVIQAGPPFRMVTLCVAIDGEPLTYARGDGLIVCTPSGSTAHNLSAGGPILLPGVCAIVVTPLNAHSLTHKPLVVESDANIEIEMVEVNEGTSVIIDGQVSCLVKAGDRVAIRKSESEFLLIRNPMHTRSHSLKTKLFWGKSAIQEEHRRS